jgi:hypothetical protein
MPKELMPKASTKSSHPDQFFRNRINPLQRPLPGHCLFVGPDCGDFVGIFWGSAFAQLKVAKQLSHLAKPLPEYDKGYGVH